MKANTYLIINRYLKSRTSDRRPYVTLACERGGALRKNTKPIDDDEEEGCKTYGGAVETDRAIQEESCAATFDHLYAIANTFNFCIILIARLGSTTVLPLYSNLDCTAGMLHIGFISEQQHFIQLHMQDGCPLPSLQVQ
ncbi:hypothetical protein M9H77_11456 [Catharanthus roseus]|uniref:Uncharacterized protein n=1 Tax=Catharanthus roseus TaxID=4058 RepID=A0ACC0BEM8_CATRO|nr:hypothetical protein M9H77_11456 [Catharanthus roseus]